MTDRDDMYREWLALRLYGELAPAEEQELDAWLAESESGRRLANELATTLGPIAELSQSSTPVDLPAGWLDELARTTRREAELRTPRRRWTVWSSAAAGFAAGLLVMWMLANESQRQRSEPRSNTGNATFVLDAPPPLATSRGPLSRWGPYARR